MTCIFCAIAAGEAPGHILLQTNQIVVLLSLEGHPLIIPSQHIAGLEGLDDHIAAEIFQTALRVARALRSETGCEGINLVLSDGPAAGQDVFHAHLHVKPRWEGDNVSLSWENRP